MTGYSSFDYDYFFSISPFLNFNAFGFWRVWYGEFELYRLFEIGVDLSLNHAQEKVTK